MEEDALLRRREMGIRDIEVCELCGRPVPVGALDVAEPATGVATAETVQVCPVCKQALAVGSLPIDATSGDLEDDGVE